MDKMDKFSRELTDSELEQVTGGIDITQNVDGKGAYYELTLDPNGAPATDLLNGWLGFLSLAGFTKDSLDALQRQAQTMDNNGHHTIRFYYTHNGAATIVGNIESWA